MNNAGKIRKIERALRISKAICIFIIGFLCSYILFSTQSLGLEMPLSFSPDHTKAPSDWIKQEQIKVEKDRVIINIKDASLSRYAPTGSMLPVLNEHTNGIKIIPHSPEEIKIGDIVTYENKNKLIIHRVIDKGIDEQGTYFILKGDNNSVSDGKIRFKDIRYVTIGILY